MDNFKLYVQVSKYTFAARMPNYNIELHLNTRNVNIS